MNLSENLSEYLGQVVEDLKRCTSGEELHEKAKQHSKVLNDWYKTLDHEEQLKIYRRYPNLIVRYLEVGDMRYKIFDGQDCENCVFGCLMSGETISKELLEDWPCDKEDGCKNHYRIYESEN